MLHTAVSILRLCSSVGFQENGQLSTEFILSGTLNRMANSDCYGDSPDSCPPKALRLQIHAQ